MKKLFKFVYSEIRCHRYVTPFTEQKREVLDAAKYANQVKHIQPYVMSEKLDQLLKRNKERIFIKQLFETK